MNGYFDLGNYTRPITTTSAEAQLWFDRGLIWCYAFNQEEGGYCFRKAIEFDEDCAMAYWGVAYANGPFYNKTWDMFEKDELREALGICYQFAQKALALSQRASPVEQALIQALTERYQSEQIVSEGDFRSWDAYATGMKKVYTAFPEDFDVVSLYAEAMITRTPWKLWDVNTGEPAEGADTLEALQVLEEGLRLIEERGIEMHAGIGHLYIHVLEMSPHPEKALPVADILRNLVPDGGHLLHMPSHIDILCGHYYNAITANEKAVIVDKKYLEERGPFSFYTTACCHDFHFLMYAAMFLGRYQPAIKAANGITALLTEEVLRTEKTHTASTLEGYYSMKMHVFVRFGKWQEILDEAMPADPQFYCVTTAMYHYAKGIAHATLGHFADAEEEKKQFKSALPQIPATRRFFNNSAFDILAIGEAMLNGELAYHQSFYEAAFAHLRKAVALNDHLDYTEPWAWMHPPRHALGALLLAQNHIAEAEEVYRDDLGLSNTLSRSAQHPDNVWSLHGYVECLKLQGKEAEMIAMQFRLDMALARTDVEINASCFCRRKHLRGGFLCKNGSVATYTKSE